VPFFISIRYFTDSVLPHMRVEGIPNRNTVRVSDRFGVPHVARALIDQGSETSLIAESLTQQLKLPRSHTSVSVYGVGGKMTGVARGLVDRSISPWKGGSPMTVSALILPQADSLQRWVPHDPPSVGASGWA